MPFILATYLSCHLPCKALARVAITIELQRELGVMEGKEIDCLIFINRKGEICGALLWTKVKQRERYREMTPGGRKVPEQTLTIVWGGWEEASNASGAEEVVGEQGGTAQGWRDMAGPAKKGHRCWETTASTGKGHLILTAFCLSACQDCTSYSLKLEPGVCAGLCAE